MLIFTSEQEDHQIRFVLFFLSPTRFESSHHSNLLVIIYQITNSIMF